MEKIKYGKVLINVKSILGYEPEKDEDGNTVKPKDVVIKLEVTSEGETDTQTRTVKEDTTSLSLDISGKGTVTVKLSITVGEDVTVKNAQLNLNEKTTLEFK